MEIYEIISKFDEWLCGDGLRFEATIVGGAALVLLNVISRATQDVDVLDDKILPEAVVESSRAFARSLSIPENWLNNDVASLKRDLPAGWESRRIEIFRGKAIRFLSLGRADLLKSKLWAFCDRGRDLEDVLAMQPNDSELDDGCSWIIPLDGNPAWADHVRRSLDEVRRKLNPGGRNA